MARLRRRRSLPDRPVLEYEEPVQTSKDLWKKVTGVDPSNWKCLHGDSCNFEHINTVGVPSARYKREADPLFPKYAEWADESMNNLMQEVCNDDTAKCIHLINKRSTDYLSREKRSADEDSLLEMALMTEGTYEATVDDVCHGDTKEQGEVFNHPGRYVSRCCGFIGFNPAYNWPQVAEIQAELFIKFIIQALLFILVLRQCSE